MTGVLRVPAALRIIVIGESVGYPTAVEVTPTTTTPPVMHTGQRPQARHRPHRQLGEALATRPGKIQIGPASRVVLDEVRPRLQARVPLPQRPIDRHLQTQPPCGRLDRLHHAQLRAGHHGYRLEPGQLGRKQLRLRHALPGQPPLEFTRPTEHRDNRLGMTDQHHLTTQPAGLPNRTPAANRVHPPENHARPPARSLISTAGPDGRHSPTRGDVSKLTCHCRCKADRPHVTQVYPLARGVSWRPGLCRVNVWCGSVRFRWSEM